MKSIDDIFGKLVQLWDSYCDEKSNLEEYPDIDSFLKHDRVAPSKQAIKDLFLSIVDEVEKHTYTEDDALVAIDEIKKKIESL